MKTELIKRLRDVNKNFLPILIENRLNENESNLSTHFDAFLDIVQQSFEGNNELICIVPTFYQLDEISPWITKEFGYLKAYSLATKSSFQNILNAQVTLSKTINASFSKSVLYHLNSDGWNGRCTMLIRIEKNSDEIILEYKKEFDLLIYHIGDSVARKIKEYVCLLFPEIPDGFFSVPSNKPKGNIVTLGFELLNAKEEIRELTSYLSVFAQFKGERPFKTIIRDLQDSLVEPVLQHSIFLQPGWEMYYSFSNSIHYQKKELNFSTNNDYGLGGAFIIVDKQISTHDEFDHFIMLVESIIDKIANRIVNFYQIDKITSFAITSAVSAIINRNYAHHIGAHVSRRSSIEKVLDRLGINVKNNGLEPGLVASIAKMRNKLENYKDERSEFIASVTSSPVSQTLNFYSDVIRPFVENTLLIDNIGRNEGICYRNKQPEASVSNKTLSCNNNTHSQLVIRVFLSKKLVSQNQIVEEPIFRTDLSDNPCSDEYVEQRIIYGIDGVDIFDSLSIPYYLEYTNLKGNFFDDKRLVYPDIQLNMPGLLGKHAIYSLLENYIRNTAKHSYNTEKHYNKPIEVILKLEQSERDGSKIRLILTDNISDGTKVDQLNEKIKKPLTDNNIGMGIADMKICACLLSEKELREYNLSNSIEVIKDNGHIAYSLYLTRPKNIAFIGSHGHLDNPSKGIFCFSNLEEFLKSSSSNFQFAIIHYNIFYQENLKLIKNKLPLRLFVYDAENNEKKESDETGRYKFINEIEEDNVLEWCWIKWIGSKNSNLKTTLNLYFDEDINGAFTKKWNALSSDWKSAVEKPFDLDVYHRIDGDISPDKEIKSEALHICYDRHGKLINKLKPKFTENHFWEHIDKNNRDFDFISTSDTSRKPFLLPYELVDAGLTNILVIDERVAEMANRTYDKETGMRPLVTTGGFKKYSDIIGKDDTQLFDACWASNIFIATHIDDVPVSNKIENDITKNHYLKISLKKEKDVINLDSKVNFTEEIAAVKRVNNEKGWFKHDGDKLYINDSLELGNNEELFYSRDIKYDCLLIHRTKLKNLVENDEYGLELLNQLNVSKIFVVTGGGVVEFLDGNNQLVILPSNILYEYILGKRPAKLLLTKILR